MPDLFTTADQLHLVKRAHERFLALRALDCLLRDSRFLEKLSSDLKETDPAQPNSPPGRRSMNQ